MTLRQQVIEALKDTPGAPIDVLVAAIFLGDVSPRNRLDVFEVLQAMRSRGLVQKTNGAEGTTWELTDDEDEEADEDEGAED